MGLVPYFLNNFQNRPFKIWLLVELPFLATRYFNEKNMYFLRFFFFLISTHYLKIPTWTNMGEAISRSRDLVSL